MKDLHFKKYHLYADRFQAYKQKVHTRLLLFFILLIANSAYANLTCSSILSNTDHTLSNGIKVPQSTIKHIMMGDYSGSQLKSGMHSLKGLSALLKKNPKIIDLDYLHPSFILDKAPQWMAIHNDVTGTSFVRLPKEVVTRQGRKGMRAAHLNLQGSYMWKSVFPYGFDEASLIKALEESVGTIETLDTSERLATYHSRINFKDITIEITVLVNTKDRTVVTAYPSGSQSSPLLGVNKSGQFPMTRHMVTRLSNSFVIREYDHWNTLSKNPPPHQLNNGQVPDSPEGYQAYFDSDYFGLPLTEVTSLLNEDDNSTDMKPLVHYRDTLGQMLDSATITHSKKIQFLKKALYQIRNFGFHSDYLLFNLAIHDDIMKFATISLTESELKDFHSFYTSSPSYWYSLFPTHVLQVYLQAGRQNDLATILGLLKHPQLFLVAEQPVLKKPLLFASNITNTLIKNPDFIQHWSGAYALRVARLKMNNSRPDLDFVQDRLNNLFLTFASYVVARHRGALKNIEESFDSALLQRAFITEIVNEYAGISSEFGATAPLKINYIQIHTETNTIIIPHYEVVEINGEFTLKETKKTTFRKVSE